MHADKPTFILSFDFEIGWGDVTNFRWVKREQKGVYQQLRPVLDDILSELDHLELPATWATVGAMITPPEALVLDHLPEPLQDTVRSVLHSARTDSFDGRDLFERVLSRKTRHLIASHSYAHIPFSYEGVDKHFVRADLKLSLESLAAYGLHQVDRYVFPENREGYYDELVATGFKVARVGADNGNLSRYQYLLSTLVAPPPAGKLETTESGLIKHYGSMMFNMGLGRYHRLPFVYTRALRGIKMAYHKNTLFHIWTHPFNFAESSLQLRVFKSFLRRVAKYRDAGKITVSTM